MNILITGAGGFVGTHLCRSLYKDYNVIGTVRTKNKQIALEKVCRIKTYVADLSKDIEIDDKIDIVIHGAARSPNPGIPINNYIYDNHDGIQLGDNCYLAFNVIRNNYRGILMYLIGEKSLIFNR